MWLRAALHAHTTGSDGELPPWALAAHYAAAGYDVLATTDHWVRTEIAADESRGLVVLPSVELNARLPGDRDGHHGLEGWNGGCARELARGGSEPHWDDALERGRRLFGLAADDSHHPGHDSDLAWTWLRVLSRTPEVVLEALRTGAFYASCGPVIHDVAVSDESVEVVSSPCRSVTLSQGAQAGTSAQAGRLGYRYGAVSREVIEASRVRYDGERVALGAEVVVVSTTR